MGEPGEMPVRTAVRETEQETFLRIYPEDLEEVYCFSLPRDPEHTKHFFVGVKFRGVARTEPIRDENGGEILLPPEWRELTLELLAELFGQHRVALERAMPVLARRFESFGWRVRQLGLI
jgi:ADP-ribose pyrophosphatase YjhB (NUDIX family)